MKCSRCNFVASNKKDICPRCELDLRPKKRELGLPIYNSSMPYEQLVAEERARSPRPEAGRNAPQAATPIQATEKVKASLWKNLLSFGAKAQAKPADAPPAQAAHPGETLSSTGAATPRPIKAPDPVNTEQEPDPLLAHLEALEKEISSSEQRTHELELPEAAELTAQQDIAPPPPTPSASYTPSARYSAAPNFSAEGPAEVAETDLAELISALDDLDMNDDGSAVSDELFAHNVPSIDANLDEIIHALDELNPEQDLDDIELFQTRVEGLTQSLGSSIDQAKEAAEKLAEQEFAPDDFLETLPAEMESLELPALGETEEPAEEDLQEEAELSEQSFDEPRYEPVTAPTPIVSPEVLEFSEDEASFDRALDEMIGDDVLGVEAVKMVKPEKREMPSSMTTDDGMEISFEIEVDGAQEAAEEEQRDPALDPLLNDLLSTYEQIASTTEQRSIAPERGAGEELYQAHLDDAPPAPEPVPVPVSRERAERLVARLSFLSEDILDELKGLVGLAPAPSPQPATVPPPIALPIVDSAVNADESAEFEIAFEAPEEPAENLNEFLLSDDELRELEHPTAEEENLGEDDEPQAVEFDASAPEDTDLAALEAQLDTELLALEEEGTHIHSAAPIAVEASIVTPVEAAEPDEAELLESLQQELSAELDALEAEGLTVYTASEEPTVEEPVVEELVTEELVVEEPVVEELVSEGLVVDAPVAEEPMVEESVGEEPNVDELLAEAPISELPPDDELMQLQAELCSELEALESEGLSVFSVQDEPAQEVLPQEDPLTADTEAEESISDIESVHAIEDERLALLQAELADELAALEAAGMTVYEAEPQVEVADVEVASDTVTQPEIEPEADPDPEPAFDAVNTGMFLLSDLQRVTELADELEPPSEKAISEDEVIADEPVGFAPVHEEIVNTAAIEEIAESTEPDIEPEPEPEPEPLLEATNTGTFLASDLARIVDLVADEKAEEPRDEHLADSVESATQDDGDVIDLSDLARLFDVGAAPGTVESERLGSPAATGMFLASDLARIIQSEPLPAPMKFAVSPALWEAAVEEMAASDCRTGEVELSAGDLSEMKQSGSLNVLFDLAEEELRDPGARRARVTAIPSSLDKQVENDSLKQALTNFEKEERILSKRRSRAAANPELQNKPIHIEPAQPWRRFTAGAVDIVLTLLVSVFVAYVTFLPETLREALMQWQPVDPSLALPSIFRFLGLTYFIWLVHSSLLISGWGQTAGAHVMKIETVTNRGEIPGIKQAALRSLSQTTTFLSGGIGLLPLFSKRKRALHDVMSCTVMRLKPSQND